MGDPSVDVWIEHATTVLRAEIADLECWSVRIQSLRGRGDEAASVFAQALEIWKDDGQAIKWLIADNMVLGEPPLDLVRRGNAQLVLDLLGRIEHGTYS